MHDPIIGFIGGGNMAGAIIDGLLANARAPGRIWVSDPNADKRGEFQAKGLVTTDDNKTLVDACDMVVLAVKPQALKAVIQPLADAFQQHRPLVVSVAAGVTAQSINRWLGGGLAIVRTMPNTPALVMNGATGLFANAQVDATERSTVETLFNGIGRSVWVNNEAELHTVTATSGSAPAYFFRFMEAMIKSARTQGLDEETAKELVVQTALGAARMVQETGESPARLREKVASPKGTTEQALLSFERDDLDAVVARAMEACHNRSIELSRDLAD